MWSLKVAADDKVGLKLKLEDALNADEHTPTDTRIEDAAGVLIQEMPDNLPDGHEFFVYTQGMVREDGTADITLRVGNQIKE